MQDLSLTPANEYSMVELADLLTRGFEGYHVPIHVNAIGMLSMIRRDSIDLTASRVACLAGQPIGLALMARRGWTSRVAAMSLLPEAQNKGAGSWMMGRLIEEAKERGEREMVLEVIEQNMAGVRLYQKAGFKTVRRLVGYRIENPQIDHEYELEEMDIRELGRLVTYHGIFDLPWQLSGATIMQHTPPAQAFRINEAYCLISDPSQETVAISSLLVKTRSRGAGLSSILLQALFANFPNKTWLVAPIFPEEMSFIFEQVGMKQIEVSQLQMRLKMEEGN